MARLAKNLVCIVVRNGIWVWVEQERAKILINVLGQNNCPQFITYEGRMINKADITGIFLPEDIDAYTRRKNGQWQCDKGKWHNRGVACDCPAECN
jgi:hypothetical protein